MAGKKRMKRGDMAVEKLREAGWEYVHDTLVYVYRPAGTVSSMCSRMGYEYCRVHHGRVVGQHTHQLTSVMRRKLHG